MTPEDKARQNIDLQLQQCGWEVQDVADLNIMAGLGVAVREFPLTTGEADYCLYIDGKVAGVIEAKKEGSTLIGVETQTENTPKDYRTACLTMAYRSHSDTNRQE